MNGLPWGRLVVLLLAVVATAWWWSSTADDERTPRPVATSSSTPSTSTTAAQPSAPPATSSESQTAGSESAARTVLTTWARPDLEYDRWWADLRPLLTEGGVELLAYTDPAQIPPLEITGAGAEDPGPSNLTATTWWFPTTEGRFGVDVALDHLDGTWKAYSIIFPGGESRRQG